MGLKHCQLTLSIADHEGNALAGLGMRVDPGGQHQCCGQQ